jgi:hypothetical protein
MDLVLMDPTGELERATRELVERPSSLEGLTIALLDISKPKGNVFLDRVEQHLNDRGIATRRYAKPTFTKPAPIDVSHAIVTECQAVIEALAD